MVTLILRRFKKNYWHQYREKKKIIKQDIMLSIVRICQVGKKSYSLWTEYKWGEFYEIFANQYFAGISSDSVL